MSELLDRYGGLVYALARRFCFEQSEVEDAVQEVFTAIWQAGARFDPALGSEETFVAMVTRRRLIDRRRRAMRRHMPRVDGEVLHAVAASGSDNGDPGEIGEVGSLGEDSRRAIELLRTLRPEQQAVIRLSICQGLSHEAISNLLDMPLGTVKTHVRRGLIALREAMTPNLAKSPVDDDDG
ncbi:MAG: sigma-70 family RNA polymerase sigma factor [Phycisphaerales bacterium]|nr:sigma-70 family RNA polymerase sigma factor [Phycisphaerales bacterium]